MKATVSARTTIKDVAKASGYSANTVSRALRNDTRLPEETRRTIARIAKEVGYIRNSLASTLRSGTSHMVAVIVNDIKNPYYSNMLSTMDRFLRQEDYNMIIFSTRVNNEHLAEQMIHTAISQSVDGIFFSPYNNPEHIESLNRSGLPFVLLDRWIPGVQAATARCDDLQGGYLVGRHLLERGHRRFLFVAGPYFNSSQLDRQAGLFRALQEAGVPQDQVRVIPWEQLPENPQAGDYWELLKPLDYTALIAYSDELAYYCMNDLRAAGVRIPDDLSLISFDYIRSQNLYLPPLTSVTTEDASVGETAVHMLINQIRNGATPSRMVVLPVRIYDDGTTGPAKTLLSGVPG